MSSPMAARLRKDAFRRATERSSGIVPGLLRTSANRYAAINIPDISKLPCKAVGQSVQNAVSGAIYFLPGYSALDGEHLLL